MPSRFMKKRHFSVVAGFGVLFLMALAAVGIFAWARIEGLKNQLAENLGAAIGAKVEVGSLALDPWKGEVDAAEVTLTNVRPGAPWDRGEIGQATVRFHWRDFLAPVQPLEVEVASWRIVLRPSAARGEGSTFETPGTNSSEETGARNGGRLGMEVTQLKGREGEVEIDEANGGQVQVHGVAFESETSGGGTWTTKLRAESMTAGAARMGESSVDIRGDAEKVTFSNLRVQSDPGIITGEGEVATGGTHTVRATLQATDLPMAMLVAAPWQMKLSGLVNGNLVYHGDDASGEATGDLAVKEGKFNVLPALGKLAALVGVPDISGVEVDQASADFDWKDHALHLTKIDVRKNDVTRISGEVDVDATGQVDGRLKLGLPNAVASKWPQLQAAVFPAQVEDYSWADVHLTGTADHLQEDLTPRLLAAGLQSGTDVINQGAQKAMDLLKSVIGP
jgi:hypothetical protein